MGWGCLAASGGRLAVVNGAMNSAVYQNILQISSHLFATSSWSALGFCSRTVTQNTPAISPLNGLSKIKWSLWSGLIKGGSCSKNLQCDWITTIVQRWEGQHSSTALSKTHCQLLWMLDYSCCCFIAVFAAQPVIRLPVITFSTQDHAGLDFLHFVFNWVTFI